jgi:hypothetical protein
MATSDTFVQEFKRLLEKIPKDISLQQLQYDYRQVALLMGMKVLDQFPEVLIGPPPSPYGDAPSAAMSGGGQAPRPAPPRGPAPHLGESPAGGPWIGPIPHELCRLVCTLMSDTTPGDGD